MANHPTPSAIRELSGSNLHRINKDEVKPRKHRKTEAMPIPKHVKEDIHALETWNDQIGWLCEWGLLHTGNREVFAMVCITLAQAKHALDEIAEHGRRFEEPIVAKGEVVGYKRRANPAIAQYLEAAQKFRRFAEAFGMTPPSKTKIAGELEEAKDSKKGLAEMMAEDSDGPVQ